MGFPAAIRNRLDANALDREWDAYMHAAGVPSVGTAGATPELRALHRLDDAPAPDPVFLATTWRHLQGDGEAGRTAGAFRTRSMKERSARPQSYGGRRMPPTRVAAAAFCVVVLALALASERMLPAHDDAPLVASALASVQPAVASPGQRATFSHSRNVSASRTATSTDPNRDAPFGGVPNPTATPAR